MSLIRFLLFISSFLFFSPFVVSDELAFLIDPVCREKFGYYDNILKHYHLTNDKKVLSDFIIYRPKAGLVRKNEVLYVHGQIESSIYDEIKKNKTSVLVLNSNGGFTLPMRKIANHVRKHKITTYVPPGATCASACAQIFSAGVQRIMGVGSRLIFHQPRQSMACYFQYLITKSSLKDPQKITSDIEKKKKELESLDNEMNLFLLEYLGVDFLDHYLSYLKPLDKNQIKPGHLLGMNDISVPAQTALKSRIIHKIDGSGLELSLFIDDHSIDLQTALKKPKKRKTKKANFAYKNPSYYFERL